MSSHLTLARPYARAAFELARDAGQLGDWSTQLGFAAAVAGDPSVARLIGHPKVPASELASVFLSQGRGADEPFGRFMAVLADNRRLAVLPEIATLYEELRAQAERVLHVAVRSAVALDDDQRSRLSAALKRRFGRDVNMNVSVDPELIGGAVINAEGVVIDGSVRAKLERLQVALTR